MPSKSALITAGSQSESRVDRLCCKMNKFTVVFRGVDSYFPRFTSTHGQENDDVNGGK